VSFELSGQSFMAISAGPLFKFNPSVSFFVNFDRSRDENAAERLERLWEKLIAGGVALMPLQQYPFSDRYVGCRTDMAYGIFVPHRGHRVRAEKSESPEGLYWWGGVQHCRQPSCSAWHVAEGKLP
jgi:hypothetical protein